jgi:hypothetical protein
MTKMTTPKVSKSTFPNEQPTQDEWFRQFGVASGYIKPTPYYGGNVFNTKVFLGQPESMTQKLSGKLNNILKLFAWVG